MKRQLTIAVSILMIFLFNLPVYAGVPMALPYS